MFGAEKEPEEFNGINLKNIISAYFLQHKKNWIKNGVVLVELKLKYKLSWMVYPTATQVHF